MHIPPLTCTHLAPLLLHRQPLHGLTREVKHCHHISGTARILSHHSRQQLQSGRCKFGAVGRPSGQARIHHPHVLLKEPLHQDGAGGVQLPTGGRSEEEDLLKKSEAEENLYSIVDNESNITTQMDDVCQCRVANNIASSCVINAFTDCACLCFT